EGVAIVPAGGEEDPGHRVKVVSGERLRTRARGPEGPLVVVSGERPDQKSMSSPWLCPAPAAGVGCGISATRASVVSRRAAIEAAFCRVDRVTFAGSMTPEAIRSSYWPVAALKPKPPSPARTCSTTTPPSKPALTAI